jgi:Holliday junction resolvase RusA-like endonuclease
MNDIPPIGETVFTMSVSLTAISKARPRAAKGGHFYTPKRTRDYERAIREAADVFVTGPPADVPVTLDVNIIHPTPVSWPKWKAAAAVQNFLFPSRGDLDNKIKAISDALNGIAYLDDVQICKLSGAMTYGEQELVQVTVTRAGYSLSEVRNYYERANSSST